MKTQKTKYVIFAVIIVIAILAGIFLTNSANKTKLKNQLKLGNEALLNLDYDDAVAAFANAIGIDPKALEAYLGISKAYISLKDYNNASDYLITGFYSVPAPTILGKLEPIEAKDLVALGNQFLSKGENELARDAFEQAQKKDPTNEESIEGLEQANNNINNGSNSNTETGNTSSNPDIMEPSNGSSSNSVFDPYGFTFMGYPIHEDHYEEWKSAVGYVESSDPFDYTYIAPGNGFGETIECWAYDSEKTVSLIGNLTTSGEFISTESHTCWQMNSPAIQYYKYCFTLYPTIGNYGHIAKEHFSGPIQPGASLTDVLQLCGYANGIPNYNEAVSISNGLQLFLSESTAPYGTTTLTLMGATYNFIIYFTSDQVTGLMLLFA